MRLASVLASAAVIPFFTTAALAQDHFDLGEIIVSGGLTPIEAEALGRAASVVTAQQIEERGITTVQDALRALPGVSVNGSGSSFTQVRLRGGEANHTLILIDGIEASGGDGEYILSGLETANIARIEVLRGPQSVYYGSNASAGVINIITRKGGIGDTYSATLELGNGTTATAFLSRRTARGGLSFALSHIEDHGYDQSGDGGEKDGLKRTTAILSGDYLVTEDLKLGFTLRRAGEDYDRRPGLTPMIDVVFLLLVFFMLASRFGQDRALPLSAAGGTTLCSGPPLLIDIGAEDLRWNGVPVSLDAPAGEIGRPAPSGTGKALRRQYWRIGCLHSHRVWTSRA